MSHLETTAKLAILPGTGSRVRRFALEATQIAAVDISDHRGMGAIGESGRPIAPIDVVVSLSAQAVALVTRSQALVGMSLENVQALSPQIVGESMSAEDALNSYEPWTDSRHPPTAVRWLTLGLSPTYDDSSVVRNNLQAARNNVRIAMDRASGSGDRPGWGASGPIHSVDVWQETAWNIPGEIANAASCAARGARYDGQKCVPIEVDYDRLKKILVAVALGLIAIGGGYVVISNYARGRGARTNIPGRGRRSYPRPIPPRRLRPGSYHVSGRRVA